MVWFFEIKHRKSVDFPSGRSSVKTCFRGLHFSADLPGEVFIDVSVGPCSQDAIAIEILRATMRSDAAAKTCEHEPETQPTIRKDHGMVQAVLIHQNKWESDDGRGFQTCWH